MTPDIRWKQRFRSFDHAMTLLREPFDQGPENLSQLGKEGAVRRFVLATELAWKTLKDYLQHQGTVISPVTPRNVVKEAFAAHILADGQVWVDMLDHRNVLSHTYDAAAFEKALAAVRDRYRPAMEELHAWLLARSGES